MNRETEVTMSLIAALLVLFSAMLAPEVSMVLAILLLIVFSTYLFFGTRISP